MIFYYIEWIISTKNDTPFSTEADQSVSDNFARSLNLLALIKRIVNVDINGNTYVYIEGSDGNIYRAKLSDVIDLIRYDAGDKVTIYTTEGADDGIYDFSLKESE